MELTLVERFWQKVDKKSPLDCWLWTAAKIHGYGKLAKGRQEGRGRGQFMATHVSVWIHTGKWPATGMHVCHTCDNPPCVNPAHLYVGTPRQNAMDMVIRNRMRASLRDYAVLTEADVRKIRAAHEEGMSQAKLAKLYQVTAQNIHAVVHRKSWRHV